MRGQVNLICALFTLFLTSANAALIDNGGGFIYDTVADVTWYDYRFAGFPGQTNYPYGTTWGHATNWVENLELSGVTGWRLPLGNYSSNGENNEIQNLFIHELQNQNRSLENSGPFTSLSAGTVLWLGQESSWDKAWSFNLNGMKEQGHLYKSWTAYALAVHDGNVGPSGIISPVPIPAAALLFSSALVGLFGLIRKTS